VRKPQVRGPVVDAALSGVLEPMIVRRGFELVDAEYGMVGAHADYVCEKRRSWSLPRTKRHC
jgi:hypothetical protein